jgi:hypothetical protein
MRANRNFSLTRMLLVTARVFSLCMAAIPAGLTAQQTDCEAGASPLNKAELAGITPQQIIQKFSANESAFKQAWLGYSFVLDISVATLEGQTVTGEFRQVSTIHWERGEKKETIDFAPQSTLREISLSKQDFDDIYRPPFELTQEDLAQYTVTYVGQQRVDELEAYVFDAEPRQMEKGRRYFKGRVWVDKVDSVIIKTCGKGVPDPEPTAKEKKKAKKKGTVQENITPTAVTYREFIDGKYWFPTYLRSDEVVHFSTNDVRIREILKYKEYRKYAP